MPEQNNRPIGILLDGCEDVTLTNNTGIGDMDFIVAKNSKIIKGSGNKLITSSEVMGIPNATTNPPNNEAPYTSKNQNTKDIWQRPIGAIWIIVTGGLILAFATYLFRTQLGIPL